MRTKAYSARTIRKAIATRARWETKVSRPLGLVLWRGRSRFDGASIVAIATGFRGSDNPKTGNMIQVWIMREDIHPSEAIATGQDRSICGGCIHRPDEHGANRTCYVSHNPIGAVWRTYQAGGYESLRQDHLGLFFGAHIRWGAYGEPTMIPVWRIVELSSIAAGHTGYTHSWRRNWAQPYRSLLMASCETAEQAHRAKALGWRFFLAGLDSEAQHAPRSIVCPASKEAGFRKTCQECGACNGAGDNAQRVSIRIALHGSPALMANVARKFGGAS